MDFKSSSNETALIQGVIDSEKDVNSNSENKIAKSLYLQKLENALKLDSFLKQVNKIVGDTRLVLFQSPIPLSENGEESQITPLTKQQLRTAKTRVYNFSKIKKSRKWLKNILLDRSDSSESDLDGDKECINDMIRFHNLQKKVKREFEAGLEVNQYQNYSSSLLASGQSLLVNEAKNKKPIKALRTVTKKKPLVSSVPPVAANVETFTSSLNPQTYVVQKKASVNDDVSNHPAAESLLLDTTKRIKLEKMLDEIPYDATLPDEILQSESSANISEPGPSCTSMNDDIVYSSQLPDEIFDTEESSASMLSQCLSQPATFVNPPAMMQPKCATAPPTPTGLCPDSPSQVIMPPKSKRGPKKKNQNGNQEAVLALKRKRLWIAIVRKEIPRAQKQIFAARKETLTNCKRMATWCQKERRRTTVAYQKQNCRDQFSRARRLTKEMLVYWKHFERVEKDYRKRAEKEAQEQLKIDMELIEAKRQQRKLNFLITQTELYAHFMSKKMSSQQEMSAESQAILKQLDDEPLHIMSTEVVDDYDANSMKEKALSNVEKAFKTHEEQTFSYDTEVNGDLNKNTTSAMMPDLGQPRMFEGVLKSYQLKGMNWLYNLYENGLNGILADEMGLGKTVQTIAFLATLAEKHKIWGPFLIVAPASTLHNWQQEFSRFTPKFKLLPYWGNPNDRKVLRKFWNQKYLHREEASFHVLVTSYQLIVQDVKYFQRIKWMYMILDEAQAIKSSSSARWKILLTFQCRNRLLLSGTPIQNTMAELWALLHFIMPTLFDSHEEFNEWFSKDIESHAENKSTIDEKHLSRLHKILMPFMLRRIKKDVENELSDKIEIQMHCSLSQRQKLLYQALKNKISIEDLMQSSNSSTQSSQSVTSNLMNLVMQFRKVCNHPDLFERRDVRSPFYVTLEPYLFPKLLYEEGLCYNSFLFNPTRYKILYNFMNIFSPDNVFYSLFGQGSNHRLCTFSFLRLIGLSITDLRVFICLDFIERWKLYSLMNEKFSHSINKIIWKEEVVANEFLLIPKKTNKLGASYNSGCQNIWNSLLFTWKTDTFGFNDELIYYKRETAEHKEMRLRKQMLVSKEASPAADNSNCNRNFTLAHKLECVPTCLPKFLFLPCCWATNGCKVSSKPREVYTYDSKASKWQQLQTLGGNPLLNSVLNHGNLDLAHTHPHKFLQLRNALFFPNPVYGLLGLYQGNGWSPISIPDKESLVNDSGKLKVLDYLLTKLKRNNHRVLIYSQMTRMIDLLEEYMLHRKHTYMRLDGSSRISDRRDMVADFQTRSDIFVFLLSTRAGGLGINLTAADTVIFYDSDWNPTVDQQAMDRAHRLGQTKQVTVYRLICKGTIEERILQRAREKSEIQRMVISGGNFKPDTLKATEVVSLLLDDDELEKKFKQKQEERKLIREKEEENASKLKRKNRGTKAETQSKSKKSVKRKKLEDSDIDSPSSYSNSRSNCNPELDPSFDSCPTSPYSEQSISSLTIAQDDDSNEGALVVDDGGSPSLSRSSTNQSPDAMRLTPDSLSTPKRGSGRSRGRPRGSRARGPVASRGRGTAATLAAAELAGAQAGKSAALAAMSNASTALMKRGRGRNRNKITFTVNHGSAQTGKVNAASFSESYDGN
ncbi:DNA helicase INO80-like isoform X2 [Dinothrombium tinctorium]|uniref:Chromatin-remodeling ATPase INO80 n=1 Tax=Dinothrombium tinctorium TaxID=1965070 RepID=A0A443RRA4_9ACAR|nr:DNA helicase INO80-like isoform X2 [Dinothrombium tinctorium]